MSSSSLFAKLPAEIQHQIWEEYFKHELVHRIGITKADEESGHPRFLRSYTYATMDASCRQVSLRLARGAMLTNRMAYEVFKSNHRLLDLGFQNPQPAPNILRFPFNAARDLVYLTNLHAVFLSKLCSPGGPCGGKIRRVALLFDRKHPTYQSQSPHWQYAHQGVTEDSTVLEEVYIVMSASRTGIPIDKLLQRQSNEYGFLLWHDVASMPSLTSWQIRLVDYLFKKSEDSLKQAGFPFWDRMKIIRAVDTDL
ncbi:hypothetical protein GGS26DRAFT_560467 [Hypomontagnella submonticulosa]|nr:hypothetical protein GGS26DRAFT_560467 [Hypomontagnella submonticulosa]